jgi:cytochrome c oxidase subunit II
VNVICDFGSLPVLKRLLLSVLLCVLITNTPGAMRRAQGPAPRVVEVTAQRFEFWPSEIRAQQDEVLELRIRSDDTMHGFRIIGAGVSVLVPKRGKGEAVASFTASRPGRYTIECSRMCGAGHNFMRATLIVEASRAGDTP